MLKNRVIIISLVIICLAAAIYYLSNIRDTKDQSSRFCSFINPEDVKQITIAKEGQTLKLTPRDNRWFVTDNNSIEIAVDSSRILPFFEFVND